MTYLKTIFLSFFYFFSLSTLALTDSRRTLLEKWLFKQYRNHQENICAVPLIKDNTTFFENLSRHHKHTLEEKAQQGAQMQATRTRIYKTALILTISGTLATTGLLMYAMQTHDTPSTVLAGVCSAIGTFFSLLMKDNYNKALTYQERLNQRIERDATLTEMLHNCKKHNPS